MLLPEYLLDVLPSDSATGIEILTNDPEVQKKAAEFFVEHFKENWKKGTEAMEEEYGDCDQIEDEDDPLNPPVFKEDRVIITSDPLHMTSNDGNSAFNEFGTEAWDETVKELEEAFPDLPFYYAVQYAWFDEHCGDTVSYEGASKGLDADRHVFGFAGWELPKLAGSGDLEYLEGELENAEDVADLLAELVPYRSSFTDAEYKEFINALVDIVTDLEEVDDDEDEDFD